MKEDQNIAILRYLNGELTASEQLAFEEELRKSESLQKEVESYKSIVKGIKHQERKKMKSNVAAVGANVAVDGFKNYHPEIPPGGEGSSFMGNLFKFLFFSTLISVVVSAYLIYQNKFPIEHPIIDEIQQKMMESVKIDTVWHTIEVPVGTTDTIIYGEEELKQFIEENQIEREGSE